VISVAGFSVNVRAPGGRVIAEIDPVSVECPVDGSVPDTLADYSRCHDATGWVSEINVKEGVKLVCEPSLDQQ